MQGSCFDESHNYVVVRASEIKNSDGTLSVDHGVGPKLPEEY